MPALPGFLSETVRLVGTLRCCKAGVNEIVVNVYGEISMDAV